MKEYIKNKWKFLIFVLISGLIGGYCTGLYIPEMYSQEMLQQLQGQGMTTEMLALSGAVQYGILYGVILGAIGLLISKKVGLWKEFRFDRNAVAPTTIITIISALCLFPGDKLTFGRFSSWVNDLYHVSPGLPKIIAGLLTGRVIEEVMMSCSSCPCWYSLFRNYSVKTKKIYRCGCSLQPILFPRCSLQQGIFPGQWP